MGKRKDGISLVSKFKELFKHSIVYGLTSSLQSVLGFILLPILTNYYTTDTFGVYSILLLLSAVSSAIFYFGASSAVGRFYYDEDTTQYRKKIVTTALIITIAGAFILISLSLLFAPKLSVQLFQTNRYARSIILALAGSALTFLVNLMTLLLRYQKKSLFFLATMILSVLSNFAITFILLTKFKLGINAPLWGVLISNLVAFVILLFSQLQFLTTELEKKYFKSILNFGLQASVAGLLFYILEWVDRLIMKDLLTLSQVGIYSLGYRLGAILNIVVILPFSLIWAPMRMQYANNANSEDFTSKFISYYTIIGVAVVLFSMLFGEEIMSLFFKNKDYSNASRIFPIIMFALLFYGYQGILDFGIYYYKKIYYYIIISALAIGINVVLNYVLIPIFGYMGAACVTLITYVFTSLTIYLVSNKLFPMKIEWRRVLLPLLFVGLIYFVINYFGFASLSHKCILFIISIVLFIGLWLNRTERLYLLNKILNLKR
jgi:O-antigen/teichoic acid export membrane protein